jgi:hypothetical protein
MYIYSTLSFDNVKQGISIPHVTNATIIFEIVSDRLAPVEYKRSGCMLTPLLIGYDWLSCSCLMSRYNHLEGVWIHKPL